LVGWLVGGPKKTKTHIIFSGVFRGKKMKEKIKSFGQKGFPLSPGRNKKRGGMVGNVLIKSNQIKQNRQPSSHKKQRLMANASNNGEV